MKYKLILPLILLLIGCETEKADMIIHNGTIYTMNDLMPTTESVAIRNGKIIALGKYRDLDDLITPRTKIINLNGAMMTPGLIEGHGHFYGLGLADRPPSQGRANRCRAQPQCSSHYSNQYRSQSHDGG